MSRVRDIADFHFNSIDISNKPQVHFNAHTLTTTDLSANGNITGIHLADLADVSNVTASNDGHYLYYDHSLTSFRWQAASGGGGGSMNNVVDDGSPQLGGVLDTNNYNIEFGESANAGADDTLIFGTDFRIYKATGGNGIIQWTNSSSGMMQIISSRDIDIKAGGSDRITGRQTGSVDLYYGGVKKFETTNTGIKTSGEIDVNSAYTLPTTDGTNGQVLQTNGAGVLSFATAGGGILNIVDDTTPQLGGDLDVNGNSISYTFSLSGSSSPNYVFSDPGANFFTSGTNNPTIYLIRGVQYKFTNIGGSHPFRIQSVNSAGGTLYSTGVSNNNGTGTVTFTPPMNAPDELYYYCSAHSNMNGTIKIVGGGGSASTGDISFSGSTVSSSGSTITLDDDVTVSGTLTSSQAGSPIITSASSITLRADSSSRVYVDQSPLRLYNVSTTNRNSISASNGDLIYNSSTNKAQIFANGSWVDLH